MAQGRSATVAVAAMLLVAGCGEDEPAVDRDAIADAARATIDRGGMDAKAHTRTYDGEDPVIVAAVGREDVSSGLAEYHLKTRGIGFRRDFDARVIKRSAVAFVLDPGLIATLRSLDIGREWLQVEAEGARLSGDAQIERSVYLVMQSPARLLHYASAAAATARGERMQVGGTMTTHYEGEVDLTRLREEAPESERAGLRADAEAIRAASGEESAPVDAWIDDSGMIRRVIVSYDTDPGVEERRADVSRFGRRVDPTAPGSYQYMPMSFFIRELEKRRK